MRTQARLKCHQTCANYCIDPLCTTMAQPTGTRETVVWKDAAEFPPISRFLSIDPYDRLLSIEQPCLCWVFKRQRKIRCSVGFCELHSPVSQTVTNSHGGNSCPCLPPSHFARTVESTLTHSQDMLNICIQ